jgi:hypothetical protein
MKIKEELNSIELLSNYPKFGSEEYNRFLEQREFLHFLNNTASEDTILFASFQGLYIYSVIVLEKSLINDYVSDLKNWQCTPSATWGYSYRFGENGNPKNISVDEPFDSDHSKILRKANPLTYLRFFEASNDRKNYIEVSQFVTHLHDLHYMDERKAYCKLDNNGDIEDVIKISYLGNGTLVTMKRETLNFHLFLNNSVLVRVFDRVIFDSNADTGQTSRKLSAITENDNEIFADKGIALNRESTPYLGWVRGFQIIRNNESREVLIAKVSGKNLEPKEYETFIAMDWKHKIITEHSCDPKELGNYFVESDKPFETSPVFFKPEVLLKYKQDTEKYSLTQNYISCRNSWYLQTYHLNEAGQVFTYLCYLGELPHSEQLHWKQFNEEPKAGIPEGVIKTDFKAEWDLNYEPLSELKATLVKLSQAKKELWNLTDKTLMDQLHYVVTDSVKEWSDEIQTLDKLVVENLNYSYLKKLAASLGISKLTLGSIKLIKDILEVKEIESHIVAAIINPFEEMQFLRTKFSAHTSSSTERSQIQKKIISENGSLKNHFRNLIQKTDEGIKSLIELISAGLI